MTKRNHNAILPYFLISAIACVDAAVATVFVYPNDFAPDGVQGVGTILQRLTGISTGYMFLLINLPLLVFAFFKLKKTYAVKNLCYVAFFSILSVILNFLFSRFDLSHLEFRAQNSETLILIAVLYGSFNGLAYSTAIIMGGATGGTDILAAMVTYYRRDFNTVWVLFAIKATIAVSSYFVYGRRALPVIVSLVCSLFCGFVSDNLLKGRATALKFEIITAEPEPLSREIMEQTEHGCTCLPAMGMYESSERSMLICVVNKRQRVEVERIIEKYSGTFAYCYPVKCTYGYFERIK